MRTQIYRYSIALILFCGFGAVQMKAQSACGLNPRLENYCGDACVVCELNGLSLTTTHTIVGDVPPGYCTFVAHSMQWVGFIAGSVNLSFQVDVTGCTLGNSIELGVYETLDCQNYNLVSNCNTAMPVGSYSFSNTVPLKPGCPYYIVIDGNGPASCSFVVTVTSGSATAPEPVLNGPISGPDHVCEGETATFSIPPAFGACGYDWQVTGGSILGPSDGNEITVLFDNPPTGEICVSASNVCYVSNQICKPVIIHANSQPGFEGPFEICAGQGYPYMGQLYPGGLWQIDFKNQYGCDTSVLLEVIEVPTQTTTLVEQICFPDCYQFGGREICSTGQFTEFLRSESPPFCDSIVLLDIIVLQVEAAATKDGDLSCSDTLVILDSDSSIVGRGGLLTRTWSNEQGDILGNGRTLEVCEPGFYILTLTIETNRGTCTDMDTIFVSGSSAGPELQAPDTIFLCRGEPLILSELPIGDKNGAPVEIDFFEGLPSLPTQMITQDTLLLGQSREIGVTISVGGCMDEGLIQIEIAPNPSFEIGDTLLICPGTRIFPDSIPRMFTGPDSAGLVWFLRDSMGRLDTLLDTGRVIRNSRWVIARISEGNCRPEDSIYIELLAPAVADFALVDSICLGETITLEFGAQDLPGTNYSWNIGGLEESGPGPILFEPDMSGWLDVSLSLERNGCFSDTLTRRVYVSAPPAQPELFCNVVDSTLFIGWDSDQWTIRFEGIPDPNGPTGSRLNDTTWVFPDLPAGSTIRFKLIAYGFDRCAVLEDSISCRVIYCPAVQVDIDSIAPICLPQDNTPIALGYSSTGNSNLNERWTGPGITDQDLGIFDPQLAGNGTHQITLSLRDSFCQYATSRFIRVNDPATPEFSVPDSVCLGDTVLIQASNLDAGYILQWDLGNATLIQDLGNGAILVRWDQAGTFDLSAFQENSECQSQSTRLSTRVFSPLPALIPQCSSDYGAVTISWNTLSGVNQYRVRNLTTGSEQLVSGTSVTFNGLAAGDSVNIVVEAVWDGPCPVEGISIRCGALPCPMVETTIDPVPDLCLGDSPASIRMNATVNNSPGAGSINWSGPGISNDMFDPVAAGSGSHFLRMTYTVFGCSYEDSLQVNVYDNPDISISGDDRLTCRFPESELILNISNSQAGTASWSTPAGVFFGDSILAQIPGLYRVVYTDALSGCEAEDEIQIIDAMNGPEEVNYLTSPANCSPVNSGSIDLRDIIGGTAAYTVYLDGVRQPGFGLITNLSAGQYLLEIEDANGCMLDTLVDIDMVPPVTLTLERDTVIERGASVRLQSQTSRNVVNYSWSPAVPCGQCPDPVVRPQVDTRYFLRVTDEFGCTAETSVFIRVFEKAFFIPNAFSPNDDGINDWFNISANDFVDIIEQMDIFDRWGNRIFSASGISPDQPQAGWDGRGNNKEMNPGVYMYCLRIRFTDGSTESRCGDVTLIR